MQYTFKWFKAYEDKYNITKQTLEKGLRINDSIHHEPWIYIYLKNGMLRLATPGLSRKKGYEQPYNDDFGPLENIYDLMNAYWGRKEGGQYGSNAIMKKFLDSGDYTIGVKPEDDGIYYDYKGRSF